MDALEKAVVSARKALDFGSRNLEERVHRLNELQAALGNIFAQSLAGEHLDEAILVGKEGLRVVPGNHPCRYGLLNNQGMLLAARYKRSKALSDLEEDIQAFQCLIDERSSEPDHPYISNLQNALAEQIEEKFSKTANTEDLNKAIESRKKAISSIHADTAVNWVAQSNSLCILLGHRYSRTKAMADLEDAIRIGYKVVQLTPKAHPSRAGRLGNLAIHLCDRSIRTDTLRDLNDAIRITQEALKISPHDPELLKNLGTFLRNRHFRNGSQLDSHQASKITQELDAMQTNNTDQQPFPTDIRRRMAKIPHFEPKGSLDYDIQISRHNLDSTPPGHPERGAILLHHGSLLIERYSSTRSYSDREASKLYSETAMNDVHAGASVRIEAGRRLMGYYGNAGNWREAYDISALCMSLVTILTTRSVVISDKQHILGEITGFASEAASVALNANTGPSAALSVLEQARGVIASSLEEMRVDDLGLKQYPDLEKRFKHLRSQLNSPTYVVPSEISPQEQGNIDEDLNKVIDEIRAKPGLQNFLLAPRGKEMQLAAVHGPIIVINVSPYRCDALLVEQEQIRIVPLPDLDSENLLKRVQENQLDSSETLTWLWDVVANPVLQALGITGPPLDGKWPHVWWIPIGPLSRFPIHAAGHHTNGSHDTVLDRVISSYSSSVRAIVDGRRRPASAHSSNKALLVAMEHTPGHSDLSFAAKEVAIIRDLCKSMNLDPTEPPCRKRDILAHLGECSVFHFAGHGYTDRADASKSHLVLEDAVADPLTVDTLLEMDIRKNCPFLAYLSACGTGRIEKDTFIDESINLITGYQLAGFRHVIGTLWEVNDQLCVDIAQVIYEGIRDGGMTDESVALGLHNASRELRKRLLVKSETFRANSVGEVEVTAERKGQRDVILCEEIEGPERMFWVPYVHFGV